MLKPNLNEYQEMATDLAKSGFSPQQTEGLVRLLDQVFTRQEAANERIVHELRQSQKEFRKEFREDMRDLRTEVVEIRRWTIMTLTAAVLLVVGSLLSVVIS